MPATRNVSKDKSASKYEPTVWGSGGGSTYEDLTVPSGQVCKVRRPGLQVMLRAGVLNDMDSLSQLVAQKHLGGATVSEPDQAEVMKLLQDPVKSEALFHMVDKVVVFTVVEPTVVMTPNDVTRREQGVIYADMVDIEDKMFIMNFAVGGTRDTERFRVERDELVGSVEPSESLPLPARRTSKH